MKIRELRWVDDFFSAVRRHVFLREEDLVLILPPNRVYKVNDTGFRLIKCLLEGGRAVDLPAETPEQVRDLGAFFRGIRNLIENDPAAAGPGIESVPYTFDYTSLPVLGEIAVTYRCNNRCRFCYVGNNSDPGPEMSGDQIKKIIMTFREEAKIPFFSFTGGEPLLRGDLEEFIAFAGTAELSVNLVSNGTLADRPRAKSLFHSGLRTAQVSVEAPDRETHDFLSAVPGSFDKTIAGIDALKSAGISVQTNTTITAANVSRAAEMPEFLEGLGITRFAMNLFIPVGTGRENGDLFFSYSGIGPVIEAVRRQAASRNMTFYWYSPVPHCHYNPLARGLGNKSCAAMDGLISVSPTGDVLPCSSYPLPLGNLLESDFRSVWFSEKAAHFKQKHYAAEACTSCSKFIACQGACPLYWNYAGTGEIRPQATCKGGNMP